MNDVLVVEISGKRPGTSKQRPTEQFDISYDHLIISNNSDGYETDWEIVNVPEDYMEWYKENVKTSENAWYAPMNRSYAIKYAREHGYKYLVQLDDNIQALEIRYKLPTMNDGITKRYRVRKSDCMMDDYIDMLVCVLKNTNAGMAGCGMAGVGDSSGDYLRERYCYSLFALNLDVCPDVFQGDFEDDIEYRLKMKQIGVPALMVFPLSYSKTGQVSNKDESGNRAAYTRAGVKRGEHMRMLYGDIYSCGVRSKTAGITSEAKSGAKYFKHTLKPFKVGVLCKDRANIDDKMMEILARNAPTVEDKVIVKVRKSKNSGGE